MSNTVPVEIERPPRTAREPAHPGHSMRSAPTVRSAPQRFFESWIDGVGGFLFSVVLPVPLYAMGEPFKQVIGPTEQTILATASAYIIAWYCSRRLNTFPSGTLQGNLGYLAPVVAIAYATAAVLLLLLRSEYSRIQLVGSGFLTIVWMAAAARFRERYLIRTYAVLPSALIAEMPATRACQWTAYEDAEQRRTAIDAMVADLGPELSKDQISALSGAAIAGVPVLDRRYVVEMLTGRTPLGGLTPNEYGSLLPARQYLMVRRLLEIILTASLLPLLSPLLFGLAAAVKLDSPGPILFRQERVGRRGQVFLMFKFRTMTHGMDGPSFTEADDKRITRVGRMMRRFRLDELPQLLNVLRGDMSWVGPRPEAASLDRKYVRDIPHFALRGIVTPGVTGWAQINQGYAHEHDAMRAKLEYDLYYIKHCSLWLDLMIVLRTFPVLIRGVGAR